MSSVFTGDTWCDGEAIGHDHGLVTAVPRLGHTEYCHQPRYVGHRLDEHNEPQQIVVEVACRRCDAGGEYRIDVEYALANATDWLRE